jgi:acyl-CoA thioesterase-2
MLRDPTLVGAKSPVEVRMCDPLTPDPSPARQRNWMRVRGELPEDALLHTAMLVYATDRTLLSTAARPHGIPWRERAGSSLDHAVWIHEPVRLEGWLLYTSESPVARSGRGMIFGAIHYPDGRRLASVAQEGLIRRRRGRS